jgi:hypothetical protein
MIVHFVRKFFFSKFTLQKLAVLFASSVFAKFIAHIYRFYLEIY